MTPRIIFRQYHAHYRSVLLTNTSNRRLRCDILDAMFRE